MLHPDALAQPLLEPGDELARAEQLAGDRVADAHGQGRRHPLAFLDDIEVVVEGRDLVDLGGGELHLLGERDDVCGRDAVIAVLDPVQVLDEQIATPRLLAEELPYLRQGRGIDGPASDLSLPFLDARDVHTESLYRVRYAHAKQIQG